MTDPETEHRSPVDGEAEPPAHGVSRAGLFRRVGAALVGGGIVTGGVAVSTAQSASSSERDRQTLEYLLELEDLQAAFYADALKRGALRGELAEYARVVGEHERDHVAYLRKTLGSGAPKPKAFDFGDASGSPRQFLKTAIKLEETGLGAYTGAAVNLSADTLGEAARIISVEARHAAWARDLAKDNPAPNATDEPTGEAKVRAAVRDTGFVKPG